MPVKPYRILIVDDEPNMLHMLSSILRQDGFDTQTAGTAREALDLAGREQFDFVLSDVRMPGMDGIKLLEHLREANIEVIVILMSAYGSVDLALDAMRKGAYDYISKPFKTDEVVLTLRKAAERERLRREVVRLRRRLKLSEASPEIVAESSAMKAVLGTVAQVAPYDSSVLITGESGTGKELAAREIHRLSRRSEGPFLVVNCGAISGNLLESELFGHVRGAFTGAYTAKPGLFEDSDGGTLLLDEIAAMEPALQVKILRTLDSGEVRRVGENRTREVSVRILAATNEDPEKAVERGTLRRDLYFRLNVVRVHIPPLRERRDDVMPLVEHFVRVFNQRMRLRIQRVDREARKALLRYDWKGNVRELQNVIERAMILAEDDCIAYGHLPFDVPVSSPSPTVVLGDQETLSIKEASKELERTLIYRALDRTNGNRSKAAELLEVSYPTLLQKMKEYKMY